MAQTRRKSQRVNGQGANRVSLESLQDDAATRLLDMENIKTAAARGQTEIISSYSDKEEEDDKDKNDENIGTPKMNTFVGLIRIANFISATAVIFILGVHVSSGEDISSPDLPKIMSYVQLIYLGVFASLVYIDSIGTVTFCWREYGELSSLHTDATSFIFILCSNRWLFRIVMGMMFMTSLSLPVMEALQHDVLPHIMIWVPALTSTCLVSSLLGWCLSFCVPHHRVPWLQGSFCEKIVRDQADIWEESDKPLDPYWQNRSKSHYTSYSVRKAFGILGAIICFALIMMALGLHALVIANYANAWISDGFIEMIHGNQLISSTTAFVVEVLSLGLIIQRAIVAHQREQSRHRGRTFPHEMSYLPLFIWFLAPYIATAAARQYLETNFDDRSFAIFQPIMNSYSVKSLGTIYWAAMVALIMAFGIVYFTLGIGVNFENIHFFFKVNFTRRKGGRKTIRIIDTMATILILVGMILGFASIFIDQYDIVFDPEGIAKDIIEVSQEFQSQVTPLAAKLKRIIDGLDQHFTCQNVYHALGTGAAVTLFASFFPGASSVVSVGSRSAYYGVRAANAMTNLASKLRKTTSLVWKVSLILLKVTRFATNNLKKLILASNSVSIGRVLPLLPPVVIGIYVMFGTFWPSRVVFFNAKQRRKHMSSRFWSWTLGLVVLIVAVLISTVLLDEIVQVLDDNIPLAKVSLEHNLGWKFAMSASAFAILGTFLNWIVALVLMISTDKDHENLTNAEKDWKDELERRELVVIKTPFGDKLQKRTHLKYKRSRISPFTWVLPIFLSLLACGFGVLANFYPKLEMIREPRGPFGRLIEKAYNQVSLFENDINNVKNDTEMECLPYATLDDVLVNDNPIGNILLSPVNRFHNFTKRVMKPIKDSLTGFRKQLILDIDEEIFGGNMNDFWDAYDLQYIGMIFVIPRVICLLILIFGCFMASIFKCTMQVMCQSLEPRKIVDAYGKVALFSMVYVVGAQLSLFNILSSFGVPFYHIYVRFGTGFVYDVVADSILLATYIGMNNEFFFAIPKRKTTVTYSVPGVSDDGPNIPGQII